MLVPLDTAMKLLEVEKAVLPSAKEPTRLQTHCIAVLASGWKNLMISASSQESLQKLSPTLLSRITTASFEHAQEENQVLRALHGKPLRFSSDQHFRHRSRNFRSKWRLFPHGSCW